MQIHRDGSAAPLLDGGEIRGGVRYHGRMRNPFLWLLELWLRRWWRADPDALARASAGVPAVVITGGSDGIGLALAQRFAAAGAAPIVLVARRPEALEAAAATLRATASGPVQCVSLDIAAEDCAERLAEALAGLDLHADVLVNSAGIGLSGPFTSHEPEDIARLLDVNILGVTRLVRRFLPDMVARGRGGVLNVASLGGYAPGPYQAAYYASKAYVISLTRAIAHEVRGQGVRVAAVAPGPVETRFHARMGAEGAYYRLLVPSESPEAVARSACFGFKWGLRLILPGPGLLLAIPMKVLPAMMVVPVIAFLLKPRGAVDAGGQDGSNRQG